MLHRQGAYTLRCNGCARHLPPQQEFDESPRMQYCPFCGLELEKLACRSCQAPLHVQYGGMLGLAEPKVAPCCGYCGESAQVLKEKRWRKKPKKKKIEKARSKNGMWEAIATQLEEDLKRDGMNVTVLGIDVAEKKADDAEA